MTANQINFAKYKEEVRHNLAQEQLTDTGQIRSRDVGMAQAGAAYANVAESQRHNMQVEDINRYDVNTKWDYSYDVQRYFDAANTLIKAGKDLVIPGIGLVG